jgi:tetratricopeptide (TPR) repeat protein
VVVPRDRGRAAEEARERRRAYRRALDEGWWAEMNEDYQAAVDAYNEALRLMPGDNTATAWRDAARVLLDEELARRRAQERAVSYNRLMARGRTALKGKHYSDALEAFGEALKLRPDDAAALKGRREARQALELARKAPPSTLDPRDRKRLADFKLAMDAGRAAARKRDYRAALNAYSQALVLMPGDRTATEARDAARNLLEQEARAKYDGLMTQGRTAVKAKRHADAVKAFGEALKVRPGDATALKEQREAQKALELARKGPPRPPDPGEKRRLADFKLAMDAGRAAARKKDYRAALNAYNQALKLIPGDRTATEARDAAQRLLDQEVAAKRKADEAKRTAEFNRLVAQGRTAFKGKRYADAVKAFGEALKVKPGDATALKEQREAQKALELAKKAPVDPRKEKQRLEDYKLAMDAGRAAAKKKNYQGALNAYNEALRLMPGDKTATEARDAARRLLEQEVKAKYDSLMTQGRTAVKAKRYADAVKAFGEALKVKPGDATALKEQRQAQFEVHLSTARAAHAAKRYADAVKSYEEALKLQPGNAEVKAALARARAKKP